MEELFFYFGSTLYRGLIENVNLHCEYGFPAKATIELTAFPIESNEVDSNLPVIKL